MCANDGSLPGRAARGVRGRILAGVAALTGLMWVACAPAQAQARYTCRWPNGTVTISDRPCTGTSPGMVYYGPVEQRSAPSYVPKSGEAPEHLRYMSARCASMSDALRTASVRGLKSEAIAELQRNYQKECSDNEREAMVQYNAERAGQYRAKQDEKQASAVRAQLSQQQQQQCDESKRILYTKRKRTDLTEGEKAELQRFEDNYHARCG